MQPNVTRPAMGMLLILCAMLYALTLSTSVAGEKYKAEGVFIEGCSCNQPCNAEMTGSNTNCETIGFMSFKGGKFMEVDLKDARLAYAGKRGEWVRIYVQANNAVQREAVIAFAKGYLSTFGTLDSAKGAKIDIDGKDGRYTAKVNDGAIINMTVEPVLGADNKNPIKYSNARSRMNPEFMQGRTVFGSYVDGDRKFELKDSNAIFNDDMNSKGEM